MANAISALGGIAGGQAAALGDVGPEVVDDPDIQKIIRSWGVTDPGDDAIYALGGQRTAENAPTDKEAYDEQRRQRMFAQAVTAIDKKFEALLKNYQRHPLWQEFLENLGEQSKSMSPKLLVQTFLAWNEDRLDSKPAWLTENPKPSDTKALQQQFPPDDRN